MWAISSRIYCVRSLQLPVNNPRNRQNQHRQKCSRHSRDFASRHHSENNSERMQFHSRAEKIRREDVILKQPVEAKKNHDRNKVRVSTQSRYQQHDYPANERSYHRNKFQRSRDRTQKNWIRRANRGQKGRVRHECRKRQQHQRANVLREQQMDIRKNIVCSLRLE